MTIKINVKLYVIYLEIKRRVANFALDKFRILFLELLKVNLLLFFD